MNPFKMLQIVYSNIIRWLTVPQSAPEMNRRNFLNVQIDAVGVGLASTAAPFLPVFLTRLGASTLAISALTFMPALTGLLLALPLGQFLQSRRSIVPWFSIARLSVLSSYALTGLVSILLPHSITIVGILVIWALATIPQTVLNISFSVVMNSVAGPAGRYELMTHRWSLLGLTNATTALLAGQALDRLPFPLNYEIVFIALSLGGLISYYFSSKIFLPDHPLPIPTVKHSMRERVQSYVHLIMDEKPFISFVTKRFIFLSGTALATPLFAIYYVKVLHAQDSSIALINIAANTTVIIGYFFWSRQSRKHGSQRVLLATTLGVSMYPILVGLTSHVWPVMIFAGLNGIFQAGLSLVMFDELMQRIPEEYSATFVAAAQALQYMSSILAPLLATWLSDHVGFSLALIAGGAVSMTGFILFLSEMLSQRRKEPGSIPAQQE